MQMTAKSDGDRFKSGADKYAAYLETTEGRLRCDLAFANLQDFLVLPHSGRSLRGLDLGCGTGATAVHLARLGIHMMLLDSSSAMLDIAKCAAREAGVDGRIALNHGDAAQVANLFPAESFDIVVCHNLLEYVDDPNSVLSAAARVLQSDSTGILSVLVRNWAGEVFKAGVKAGDLGAVERNLTTMWGDESLYGGRVRLFTLDSLQVMAEGASLSVSAERGVRVISDYLPPQVSRREEYERIFELERKLGSRPEFAAVARYIQVIAHHSRASSSKETGP
jgi:S-adenosylmethionine-dependent methyltransferase